MSFTIAVSGKGGTGKTTFAGMILRYILENKKGAVLAVDADANTNLNEVLGVDVQTTIGDMREMMKTDVPTGMTKDVWFEYQIQRSLTEAKGFDLLAMGRPEGAGCYCAANSVARMCVDVLTKNYSYVVIDNEAGMEHFSRLATRDVDLLFILSDSSRRGILTAARILEIIKDLKLTIKKSLLVLSRVDGPIGEDTRAEIDKNKLDLAGVLPMDEEIYRFDRSGKPTFQLPAENPVVREAWRIFDQYIK
ncbi:MAG: carbon monoxide dehydrogenase [Syntrophus sp. RIFOXYC2_FULL_54_9]|nr:MAG: carbon monoxide dehydrogenase [Syntrophus sp. RIFOXYC2_FULL_54_9]